jgi:hypothetical protein
MTPQELIVVAECCAVFYAITYFVGGRIYAALAERKDLAELQAFSGGHMALLHSLAGTFMVVYPWLERPAGNPLTTCISVAIGLVMLCSVLFHIVRRVQAKRREAVNHDQPCRTAQADRD